MHNLDSYLATRPHLYYRIKTLIIILLSKTLIIIIIIVINITIIIIIFYYCYYYYHNIKSPKYALLIERNLQAKIGKYLDHFVMSQSLVLLFGSHLRNLFLLASCLILQVSLLNPRTRNPVAKVQVLYTLAVELVSRSCEMSRFLF